MIGLSKMGGSWSWRIPLLLEALFPAIVCATIFLLTPESPRYYVMRRKPDAVRRVIAQYHTTNGDMNQPIVDMVISQVEASIENDRDSAVLGLPGVFHAGGPIPLVVVLYSIFQQWNGGGIIITYYMVPALEIIGVTRTMQQLGITLGNHSNTCSALLIATMHNLYPVEVLALALRAKGMDLYALIQGGAGAVQAYGISVGIERLGYKIWVVYIAYNCIQLGLSCFVFPETVGLSLQINAVFETPGVAPVKMSLKIQKTKEGRARIDRDDGRG